MSGPDPNQAGGVPIICQQCLPPCTSSSKRGLRRSNNIEFSIDDEQVNGLNDINYLHRGRLTPRGKMDEKRAGRLQSNGEKLSSQDDAHCLPQPQNELSGRPVGGESDPKWCVEKRGEGSGNQYDQDDNKKFNLLGSPEPPSAQMKSIAVVINKFTVVKPGAITSIAVGVA